MEYRVAPSYEKAKILKIDPETRTALISEKCDRCGGSGEFYVWGTCFKCMGAREITKTVKIYTPEEYNRYIAAQERARQRRADAEAARKQALIDASEENKKIFLKEKGYDPENPLVYIVYGENTFTIKDFLKEQGGFFTKVTGWYFSHPIELPESYSFITIPFDEIFEWVPLTKKTNIKEDAETAILNHTPQSKSEYVGEIKERLHDLHVTLVHLHTTQGYYGVTYIYTFKDGDNTLIWMTSADKDIEEGDSILLTGTVKSHDVYKGEKQTKLSRCIIKKF